MCGIAGFCSFRHNYFKDTNKYYNTLVKMRECISHRGHDATGEFLRKNVGFSHTRLSIRDIKSGSQPMTYKIGEHEYTIVYNGEIYNTDEITSDLTNKGYTFSTSSDTEVILLSYIEYGEKCVEMLNGIFAFAIFDSVKNKLFLFRDRSGIKPLFYTITNDTLIFASEIKALFKHPYVKPEADIDSFREIIGIGPARTDGCGVFKGIKEIKQGCFAVFSKDCFYEKKYWTLKSCKHTESYEETIAHVRYLVESAIKMQMVSDVEVCTFLSGGIDSSIVTAIAYKVMSESGNNLNSFFVCFLHILRYSIFL